MTADPLGTETQQREEVGEINEALSLSLSDTFGQLKPRQVIRQLDFDLNDGSHMRSLDAVEVTTLAYLLQDVKDE